MVVEETPTVAVVAKDTRVAAATRVVKATSKAVVANNTEIAQQWSRQFVVFLNMMTTFLVV